ncbi:hypothetical protein NLJ89_g8686 [Agrocybe chaxingu]|uniref:Serine/threonine-protein kinase RIO1 n=1 Tax=Agrocybe chaxingu TaxID=84603 RepID=A0A9W8JU69_9AGAR|nr:hypothetical protein NLJ89_g8686 [Agrocybe chaxingu]
MASIAAPIVPGQFDDADELNIRGVSREGHAYIDTYDPTNDPNVLHWSEEEDDEEDEIDGDYDDSRVEDEDWENAERDFTKQYNRLRQHAAIRTGNAQGTAASLKQDTTVAAVPVVNHPKITTSLSKPTGVTGKDRTSDQLAALSKYNSRLAKIDVPYVMGVGVNRKGPSAHANLKDKSDRATNEQVLDPRTRLILFKMIGRGLIHEVNGCANVYHASTPDGRHLALKIYKTSILVFKDRDKYVTGEYRFRRGYSRNPRKMVRLWAEKEMRNLKRLVAAGIHAPDPVEVRENVLVMAFVGDKDGWASPRLKDASLPPEDVARLYEELVLMVRRMFHVCKLVHADLSEYNVLYHEGHPWIIDVSQSVEHDHPSAFDFLRNDIKNVEDFFGRLGVKCLGLRRCFDFVTRERLSDGEGSMDEESLRIWLAPTGEEASQEQEQEYADRLNETGELKSSQKEDSAHEDSVFLHSFIPRTLNEIYDPERDVEKFKRGDNLIYADTIGLVPAPDNGTSQSTERTENAANGVPTSVPKVHFIGPQEVDDRKADLSEGSEEESEDVSDDDEDGGEGEEGENAKEGLVEKKPRGHRHEDKESKKERKKAVKAEAKEKRKHKMPKAEKRRLVKRTSSAKA